ncbi:hypothetical protein BDZ89DRAFT_1056853 [Hymenopellis radicata]|nr:hypothetical protein BDZ89DRAFT_1056853 [Hymenopellis radicata]
MALAQRLNELATANSEGLLNDEEYRLLRQDVFERHAGQHIDAPTVTIVGRSRAPSAASSSSRKVVFQPLTPPPQIPRTSSPSPHPAKTSITSGVTTFLKRATSRKAPKDNSVRASGTTNSLKRAFTPRKLTRKQSLSSIHTTSSGTTTHDARSVSSHKASLSSDTFSPPLSPTRSTFPNRNLTPPRQFTLETGDDIFEDGGLSTSKELIQFINDLEEEGRRVMKAFDELEQSTASRPSKQDIDHQTPGHTTTTILLTDPDWRDPTSKSAMLLPDARMPKHQRHTSNDALSVRSASSMKAKPLSRSTSSRASPFQATPLHRKGSLSSLSSQGTSSLSVRPALSNHGSLSRSAGHLPLSILREGERSSDTVDLGSEEMDTDVMDIRRRRLDVAGRYEARLEYLRARLKGAELHEKLLKK